MEQLFQWISVLDKYTCSQCRQRAGKLYTKAQLEKIGAPPFHSIKDGHYSNCRCYLEFNSEIDDVCLHEETCSERPEKEENENGN